MTKQSRAKRIADLNDRFRKNLVTGGRTYMTAGVWRQLRGHCPVLKSWSLSAGALFVLVFHGMSIRGIYATVRMIP